MRLAQSPSPTDVRIPLGSLLLGLLFSSCITERRPRDEPSREVVRPAIIALHTMSRPPWGINNTTTNYDNSKNKTQFGEM